MLEPRVRFASIMSDRLKVKSRLIESEGPTD